MKGAGNDNSGISRNGEGGEDTMSDWGNMHIFAQDLWHSGAYIMADRRALSDLREAIDVALDGAIGSVDSFITYDGEGYTTYVCLCEEPELMRLESHYRDEICASGWRDGKIHPHDLIKEKAVDDGWTDYKED